MPLPSSDRTERGRQPAIAVAAALAAVALLGLAVAGLASSPTSADAAAKQARKGKVVLKNGHIDAASARIVGGRLRTFIKDATRPNGRVKWRRPGTAVIRLNQRARVRLPAGMGFVARKGTPVWLIPQVQRPGVIWAGWNTEEIGASQIRGDVIWTLRKVRGPGKLVVFQTGSFGESDVIFNSRKRLPQRLAIPTGTHAHANWAFTRKGVYRMRYTMSARSAAGKRLSDTGVLTFRVG